MDKILKEDIIKLLDDKKIENIIEIDTSKINERLSDLCVIGTGTSSRHAQAVADYLYRFLKSQGFKPKFEGTAQSGWILIEASGIEVHLFKPDLRDYYNIEEIMKNGSRPAA